MRDRGGICRELARNSQTYEKQNRKNTRKKKKFNYTCKTIFMWFGNIPTFIELQGFHN